MVESLGLAIDQGTHATRAMLVDERGRIRFSSYVDIALNVQGDRVEQNPGEILASVQTTVDQAIRASKKLGRIACAGLATQRSSLVAWDRHSGRALSPVISWQDCRAATWLQGLTPFEDDIKQRSGLPLSAHYGASKLRWLLTTVPGVQQTQKDGSFAWGPLSSFLLFHLLEGAPWLVDHANAQRTQLFNLHTLEWDSTLLRLFEIPSAFLPSCRPICSFYGTLNKTSIPMMAVTGDQQAACCSLGPLPSRTATMNLGTGAFVLVNTHQNLYEHPRLLSGIATSSQQRRSYLVEGTVNGAGAALSWAAKKWNVDDVLTHLADWLATTTAPPLFLNSVGGLGSPWWRPYMVPRLLGDGTVAERLVAVAESILFLLQANIDVMEKMGLRLRRIQITGGLSRVDGLCQRLADLSQKEVSRPAESEATARGTAWLALGCPQKWPLPGRGRLFRPQVNYGLAERYDRFCDVMGKQ